MSDFTPTHTWHFLGDEIPVAVRHEYDDGFGVIDEHETPSFAKADELTPIEHVTARTQLTDQEKYDAALEKHLDRAADFSSNWSK